MHNRTQRVKIGDFVSDEENLVFGVPQGSILGPTLFIIYINDMCRLTIPQCEIFAYADDTALIVRGSNWDETFLVAENALTTIMSWLDLNLHLMYKKQTMSLLP